MCHPQGLKSTGTKGKPDKPSDLSKEHTRRPTTQNTQKENRKRGKKFCQLKKAKTTEQESHKVHHIFFFLPFFCIGDWRHDKCCTKAVQTPRTTKVETLIKSWSHHIFFAFFAPSRRLASMKRLDKTTCCKFTPITNTHTHNHTSSVSNSDRTARKKVYKCNLSVF